MAIHCTYNIVSRSSRALLIVLLLWSTGANVLLSQEIVTYTQIEKGWQTDGYESMVSDGAGHYYVGMTAGTGSPGYVIGDTLITGFRNDYSIHGLYGVHDLYYLKFDNEYNVVGSFIIDNAEYVIDYYATPTRSIIGMTLQDQVQEDSLYPITLNGEVVIDRTGRRGHGVLIAVSPEMQLESMHFPTSGMIWQVVTRDDYVYMGISIRDYEPYVLIGSDTIFNHKYPEGGGPGGYEYGRQTIVLCKYDLINEQAVWWRRIGSTGYDQLYDMEIDAFGDLVIFGTTSSGRFRFDENYIIENMAPNKPFIGKYNLDGDLIWGTLNNSQLGEGHTDMSLDHQGNSYQLGFYWTPEYRIHDTVLYNFWGESSFVDRSFVIKRDANGEFQWIRQLEGAFESTRLHDVAVGIDNNVYISGYFRIGDLEINNTTYQHEFDGNNAFIYSLNSETGAEVSHFMTEGRGHRSFLNLITDQEGHLNTYLVLSKKDTIAGVILSSPTGTASGFLIKLTTDFPSSVVEVSEPSSDFLIYPNPVSSGESILIDISDARNGDPFEYALYNSTGVGIESGKSRFVNGTSKVHLNHLSCGLYWISITYNKTVKVEGFIIH